MKNRNRSIFLALSFSAALLINQSALAAPTSAPPAPNQPDAQFNSISAGGAVAGVWTFVVDKFGAISNAKPAQAVGGGYTAAQCKADGGYQQSGSTSCVYPVTVVDPDGLAVPNLRINGQAAGTGIAGTLGEGGGVERYGADFSMTNVNPAFPKGTYRGSLIKGVGEFAAGLFKFTSSDGLHSDSQVQLADGTHAIDATGDVAISGHLQTGSIGNYYTLMTTQTVPGLSDSPVMSVSCNGTDIAMACMGGGSAGNTAAFDIKYMRLYPFWSNTCNGQAYNTWNNPRSFELHVRCFDPTY